MLFFFICIMATTREYVIDEENSFHTEEELENWDLPAQPLVINMWMKFSVKNHLSV